MVFWGEGMEQMVRMLMRVSISGCPSGVGREERIVLMCSAPQERMRSVPVDSVYPAAEAVHRSSACMWVLGSTATYLVTREWSR